MHTIDEAYELWCPHSRVMSHCSAQDGKGRIWEGGYSWNRAPNTFDAYAMDDPPYTPRTANCIGDKCAMWRWARKQPNGIGFSARGVPDRKLGVGFCGLMRDVE